MTGRGAPPEFVKEYEQLAFLSRETFGSCLTAGWHPGHGEPWNLGRPFSRPGKSWKIAKVMESHGK